MYNPGSQCTNAFALTGRYLKQEVHLVFFYQKRSHRKILVEVESDNLDKYFYFEQINDEVYDTSDREELSENEEKTVSKEIDALRRLVDSEQPTPFEYEHQQCIDDVCDQQLANVESANDLDQQPQPPVAAAVDYKALSKCSCVLFCADWMGDDRIDREREVYAGLDKQSLDMLILGKISSFINVCSTTRHRKGGTKGRERARNEYQLEGLLFYYHYLKKNW